MLKKLTSKNTYVSDVKIKLSSDPVQIHKNVLNMDTDELYLNDVVEIAKGEHLNIDPIDINVLKEFIAKIEANNCNYIAIYYHVDHNEYEFFGVDVHAADENEIQEYYKKVQDINLQKVDFYLNIIKENNQKIANLQDNIRKLKRRIKK